MTREQFQEKYKLSLPLKTRKEFEAARRRILKGVNSYAALGRYYLANETTVPEELYEYMDLGALGCRYEDEHPGVFIGSDYVCYPAEEQDLTMEMQ